MTQAAYRVDATMKRLRGRRCAGPGKESPQAGAGEDTGGSGGHRGLSLLGSRMLNEAEVHARRTAPLPRTSPPASAVARRTGVRSDPTLAHTAPVAVIDLSADRSAAVVPRTGDTTTTRSAEGPKPSIGIDSPKSPSNADDDARAESESSC